MRGRRRRGSLPSIGGRDHRGYVRFRLAEILSSYPDFQAEAGDLSDRGLWSDPAARQAVERKYGLSWEADWMNEPETPPYDDPETRDVTITVNPLEPRQALIRRATRELSQVHEERIRDMTAAGWVYPYVAPNEERDLGWLALRLRGLSWHAVAEAAPPEGTEQTPGANVAIVKTAVRAIAGRAGIVLPRRKAQPKASSLL